MSPFALCAWYKERDRQRHQIDAQRAQQHRVSPASHPTEFVCLAAEPNPEACAAFGVDHCFAKVNATLTRTRDAWAACVLSTARIAHAETLFSFTRACDRRSL